MADARDQFLPFRLHFSTRAIADLHRRIDATRWPQVPFATGWSDGTDDRTLRDLVRYWREEFDWFAAQERLNRYAQLRGPMGARDELHCVVMTGAAEGRVPVLMLHGWPGSFVELLRAGELLAEGRDGPPCDVVIPSLPGFGFSDPPSERGMHPGRIGERMHDLMTALGYERYAIQGGDWGAIIGARMAQERPESTIGLHLNFAARLAAPPPGVEATDEERAWQEALKRWRHQESAYSDLQRTKPQTLAYALNDSPVGLLAWILEKIWSWTDHGDDLWAAIDRDEVLTNVTLYWLTGTALSAARTYHEAWREDPRPAPARVDVPTAYASFPAEPWATPRSVLERNFQLVRFTEMPGGGHFAAWEEPQLLARDVVEFLAEVG
jgi:pimeloyl-ACP methyl ester carboxylesterase